MEPSKRQFQLLILDDFVREKLRNWTDEIENRLEREGLSHALHFVLLELVGNAVKANLKRVFFNQHGYDLSNADSYQEGIQHFMVEYPTLNPADYEAALKQLDFVVEVQVDLNHDRLLIFVENNTILVEEEERRIRRQLAGSMSSIKNIVEFSIHYGDETEGRGLGLAMVVLLMRDMGFDPENFRVFQKGKRTIARIEFPINKDYVPIRERYNKEKERLASS